MDDSSGWWFSRHDKQKQGFARRRLSGVHLHSHRSDVRSPGMTELLGCVERVGNPEACTTEKLQPSMRSGMILYIWTSRPIQRTPAQLE